MGRSRAVPRAPRVGARRRPRWTRPSGAWVPRARIHRPPRRPPPRESARASSSSHPRRRTGRMATRTGARRTRRRWSATERRPRDSGPGMGPRGTRDRVQEGGDPSRRTTRSTGRSPRRSCRITHRRGTSSTNNHRQMSHRRHQCPPPPAMAPTRSVCPGGTPTADRRSRSRRRITPRPSPSPHQPSATRVTSARSTCWSWW